MRSIDFEGQTIEYDERCFKSYKWQKALNSGNGVRSEKAVSRLFCGRDGEYANLLSGIESDDPDDLEELDDAMDVMPRLLAAIMDDAGQMAKN